MTNAEDVLRKRSVRIAGHATSVSLEEPFWRALKRIAERRGRPLGALIADIDQGRMVGLSSAIRLFVLADLESRTGDAEVP